MDSDVELPQFDLLDWHTVACARLYKTGDLGHKLLSNSPPINKQTNKQSITVAHIVTVSKGLAPFLSMHHSSDKKLSR